jgi:hypothetical protein
MKKNLSTVERVLRVTLGGALAIWALVLLFAGGSFIWLVLYLVMIALAVDFVATGIRGYCPLYHRLGWSTAGPKPG